MLLATTPSICPGPDCIQLKASRSWDQTNQSRQSDVSLGSTWTYFPLLQLSLSFCFHSKRHLQSSCFLVCCCCSMRSHRDVEYPTHGSFQPFESNVCLCQGENGAFSCRYFSFHWWKESLSFVRRCVIFYHNSWYRWRKKQAFRHTALVKNKFVCKT